MKEIIVKIHVDDDMDEQLVQEQLDLMGMTVKVEKSIKNSNDEKDIY